MIEVEIIDDQENEKITESQIKLVEKVIQETAVVENIEDGEVVVSFVDDQQIHELNLSYRGIDRPTDVLSFAITEKGEDEPDIFYEEEMDQPNLLGDIVISIPRAMEQAKEYGHSFDRELSFLTVHGFLHLLGYDHEIQEEEEIMFAKQEQVLNRLKITR